MRKTLITITSIICSLFIVLVLCGIIGLTINPNKVDALNEPNLIIKKTQTVTVYVTGEDVEYISGTLAEDKYYAKPGTQITVYAVNESKIFESWSISGGTVLTSVNSSPCEVKVEGNVTIEANRRDPLGTDRGKYMYNKFTVSEAEHLIAIQEIIKHGPNVRATDEKIIDYYDLFFSTFPEYEDLTTYAQKAKFTTDNKFHTTVQYGYYFIEGNIALMDPEFIGIGSPQYPFRGVFCGDNDGNYSKIITTITTKEKSGNTYYGLFGILDSHAVIRNLKITTSIGVASGEYKSDDKTYIGGIAGYLNKALLYNLEVSTTMSTDVHSTHVHAGGIAGHYRGGISALNKITYNGFDTSWGLNVSSNSDKHIFSGYIAGVAKAEKVTNPENANLPAITDTYHPQIYFKGITLNLSNTTTNIHSESGDSATGNLVGYIKVDTNVEIDEITINNEYNASIQSTITRGDAYVGGLVGLVEATDSNYTLSVGEITFNSVNSKHSLIAQTSDANSEANVYSGGLFGYIKHTITNGEGNVFGDDTFKNGYYTDIIDGKDVLVKRYLFNGDFSIKSIQNGKGNSSTTGKSISGGLVGKGLFDINGTEADPTNILISNGGRFEVDAVQAASSSTSNTQVRGDIEHCIASMTYGIITTDSLTTFDFNYINIYANNAYVTSTREVGSRGMGHISVSGFNGYIKGTDVNNVNLFINKSKFDLRSLSYEIRNGTADYSNNAYCGGIFSRIENVGTVQNLILAGFDVQTMEQTGTTLKLGSIQNTQAGGEDTRGENYVGGLIGHCQQLLNLTNCTYFGSKTGEDEIIMQGHQNPDTSFCGGILGLNWEWNVSSQIKFTNLEVRNATIKGYGTVTDAKQPDMYVAGAIGASFRKDCGSSVTTLSKIRVFDSVIQSNGNEKLEVYAAGICGAVTWSGTQNFADCYVYNCDITASANAVSNASGGDKDTAYVAGICSHKNSTTSRIAQCVVAKTRLSAYSSFSPANVSGVSCNFNSGNTECDNNYLNVIMTRNGNGGYTNIMCYGGYTSNTSSNNYYTDDMSGDESPVSGRLMAIELDDFRINNNSASQFNLIDNDYEGNKFYPIFNNGTYFQANNLGTNSNVTIQRKNNPGNNASDLVDLWINAKSDGSTSSPLSYETIDDAHRDGWFCLGTIVVYTGQQNGEFDGITDVDTTYIADDGNRYKYDSEVDGERFLRHETYSTYKIESGYKEIPGSELVNKTLGNYEIYNEYDIKLYDSMPYMEIKFTIPNLSMYHLNILDSDGNIPSAAENSMYGTFELSSSPGVVVGTTDYTLIYHPNENPDTLNSFVFYVTFDIGSGSAYENNVFRFVVSPNVRTLVAVETASYTPSLNTVGELGSAGNPFIFRMGQTVKFIPVFSRINDLDGNLNNDDTNVEYVTYSLSSTNAGTMKSSGELVISSTIIFTGQNLISSTYSVRIRVKDNAGVGEDITVYFVIARNSYNVSYSIKGTDVEGATYASDSTDYYFSFSKYSNYSGVPAVFTIDINNTTYDLISNSSDRNQFTLADGSEIEFDDSTSSYNIKIPADLIEGDIVIEINLVVIYEVTLVLNNKSFNPEYGGMPEKVFYVPSGTILYDYFFNTGKTQMVNGELQSLGLEDVKMWVNSGGIYGYTFNGFYLVEDASSLNSYGNRFEDLCTDPNDNTQISTNITFYGSWSFLIELIEAPGTKIKSSFPESFMRNYKTDLVHNSIQIPINNNRGYVFTIEKDSNFYGEASVKAYSVTQIDGENIIDEITIEKYHDNMYLYFIPPSEIDGYLVIQTSATNSEIIVGENTSKVSDEIIPADGIYTFKYATNHTNINGEKSYIYNYLQNDSSLKKNFALQFYRERYNPQEKFARFTSSDGGFSIDVRNGSLGHAYNGNIPTYFIEFHDTNEHKTTIASTEVANGIKMVMLLFDGGSVDDTIVEGMKIYANTALVDDGWVEISGVKGTKNNYDIINYSFDTSKNYKYFYITNETGTTQHVHKFGLIDNNSQEMIIDLDKPLDPDDSNGRLDRSYEVFDGFELTPRDLKVGTIIKVYYYKYINGELANNILASYEVELEGVNKINLSDFVLLDGKTKAFNSEESFSSFLGNTEGVISEVYYFSITPTNGTDFDEIDETNYVIHSGYVNQNDEFIEGRKTSGVHIENIPLEEDFGELISLESSLQEKVYTVTQSRDTYLKYTDLGGDSYYTFTDIDEYSVYKFNISGLKNPGNDASYITLVNEIGYDTILTSEKLNFYLGEIKFKAFTQQTGIINVYGSVDGVKWSTPMPVEIEALAEKEYTLDVSMYDFIMYKIDSIASEDIELRSLTVNDKVTKVDFNVDFNNYMDFDVQDGIVTYNVNKKIIGDLRHEGKKFVLALQLIDNNEKVLSSLPGDIYIKVGDTQLKPNDALASGLNVMYFNLSSLIDEDVRQYDFEFVNLPSGYKVVVQLLEVTNAQKPAMGEVRCQIIDGVHTPFKKGDYSDHEH